MEHTNIPEKLASLYAQIVDDQVFSELADIVWPEFTQQGPGFSSKSAAEAIAALEFVKTFDCTFHLVANQHGAWTGDRYSGITYCVASHIYTTEAGQRKYDMGIRYFDEIEIRDSTPKYLSRNLDVVYSDDTLLSPFQRQ